MKEQNLLFIAVVALFSILVGCEAAEQPKVEVLEHPASAGSAYPYLYSNGQKLYMSWLSTNNNGRHSLNFASYSAGEWSRPATIAQDSSWFINWADFPSITANEEGPLAAHWLDKKSGGPYSYDVNISIADTAGQWSPKIVPHKDGTATEHGFVSMIPWGSNHLLAVWLDGRRTADRTENEYYDLNKAMTLRGAVISPDGTIDKKFLIDDSVCDCCQTSLVKTADGAMVAYRNRTEDEVRDIAVSRFDGTNWTSPQIVYEDNWKIGACPVNGPKLASSDATVAVAWHTAAEDKPVVKFTTFTDNGKSFKEPALIGEGVSLGRVDVVQQEGLSYVSWMAKDQERAHLNLSVINSDSELLGSLVIDTMSAERKSGFPQMELLDGALYFAWTDVDSTSHRLTTRKVRLPLSF